MKTNLKLLKKAEVGSGTMAFYFSKPEGFEFRAGQFADFTLINPPETDSEGETRTFSLALAPHEADLMVATRMRDSAFKRVLRDLPEGTEMEISGPFGDFTLHQSETTPAVFVIGGIGVTPVLSMVAAATQAKTAHKIILLHSSRTPADLPFKKDFTQLASENPNFTYVPVASDSAPANWPGERGRIDAAMINKYVTGLAEPKYYLSGPAGMVKAMRQLLLDNNTNADNIRTEEFSGY